MICNLRRGQFDSETIEAMRICTLDVAPDDGLLGSVDGGEHGSVRMPPGSCHGGRVFLEDALDFGGVDPPNVDTAVG
jgi:hypothetical protein